MCLTFLGFSRLFTLNWLTNFTGKIKLLCCFYTFLLPRFSIFFTWYWITNCNFWVSHILDNRFSTLYTFIDYVLLRALIDHNGAVRLSDWRWLNTIVIFSLILLNIIWFLKIDFCMIYFLLNWQYHEPWFVIAFSIIIFLSIVIWVYVHYWMLSLWIISFLRFHILRVLINGIIFRCFIHLIYIWVIFLWKLYLRLLSGFDWLILNFILIKHINILQSFIKFFDNGHFLIIKLNFMLAYNI